jgi:hypothetical protein
VLTFSALTFAALFLKAPTFAALFLKAYINGMFRQLHHIRRIHHRHDLFL